MSNDYTYTDKNGHHIGVYPKPERSRIILGRDGGNQNVVLAMEDAPEFALAILKAAGYGGGCAGLVLASSVSSAVACLESHIEYIERNAKEAALTKRRDELAKELNGGGIDAAYDTYAGQPMPIRTAIDRIIELEQAS